MYMFLTFFFFLFHIQVEEVVDKVESELMSMANGSKSKLKELTRNLAGKLGDKTLLGQVNSGECSPSQIIANISK